MSQEKEVVVGAGVKTGGGRRMSLEADNTLINAPVVAPGKVGVRRKSIEGLQEEGKEQQQQKQTAPQAGAGARMGRRNSVEVDTTVISPQATPAAMRGRRKSIEVASSAFAARSKNHNTATFAPAVRMFACVCPISQWI